MTKNDFYKFAMSRGLSSLTMDRYANVFPAIAGDGYINPCILEEHKTNAVSMDIFSRLMADRIIFLGVEIDYDVANIIQAQLLYLESQSDDDISMYINSPGGYITSGMGIYDTMNLISPDVSTICTGLAASMGAFLLSSGAKGKRYALPNADIMIHQPIGGCCGQASEMEIAANRIISLKKKLNTIIAANTGQPYEKVVVDTDRDNWMTAEEACEYGLVDKVVSTREKKSKSKKTSTDCKSEEKEVKKRKINNKKIK